MLWIYITTVKLGFNEQHGTGHSCSWLVIIVVRYSRVICVLKISSLQLIVRYNRVCYKRVSLYLQNTVDILALFVKNLKPSDPTVGQQK
jgi:hypothetical protein